jgi:hypothetical protein
MTSIQRKKEASPDELLGPALRKHAEPPFRVMQQREGGLKTLVGSLTKKPRYGAKPASLNQKGKCRAARRQFRKSCNFVYNLGVK